MNRIPLPRVRIHGKPPESADVAIVGGGIVGVSVAFHLARMGYPGRVVVLEQGVLGSGSTTRNAGRFRVHFFSWENTEFAVNAVKRLEEIPRITGVNPLITRGGYLWLFESEANAGLLRDTNRKVWTPLGVPVRFLDTGNLSERYPYLNLEGVELGVLGPQDGSLHHDYLMTALVSYASMSGSIIVEGARVDSVIVEAGRVRGVRVEGFGTLRAEKVVIAGGSWSREIARRAGIDLPLQPVRKSLLVTTPYKFTVKPLVILFEDGGYLGQTLKGEIVAAGRHDDPKTLDHGGVSLKWLIATAKTLARLLKAGRHLRILRAWSGTYNMSPDHSHLLGRDSEWPEGLYVATGFSGHGLMMAPYSGELLARLIAEDKEDRFLRVFSPERFREGRLIREGLIIG